MGTKQSGDCDPKFDGSGKPGTISLSSAGGNDWTVLLPGVEGGCPGTLNPSTCHLITNCEFKGEGGAVVGTLSADLHFSGSTFDGSTVVGYRPPVSDPVCQMTSQIRGTKL